MATYIHGATCAREADRLEIQAAFAATFSLCDLDVWAGQWVLDLACGVGAMTGQLATRFPTLQLVGVDHQLPALHIAQAQHPIAAYLQADAAELPFANATFDFVHGSWLLEHLRSPQTMLREVHRVLKGGGYCQFSEVDNTSFWMTPEDPDVCAVLEAIDRAQIAGGGDPYIGRRLDQLLRDAGFVQVEVHAQALRGDAANPFVFQNLITIFTEIFASVGHALGPEMTEPIRRATARLRMLPSIEGSAIYYAPVIGRGTRL
jgi:SAM-dependent methyltransferase